MPRPLGIKPFVARATVESLREEQRTGRAGHWPSLGSWAHAYLVWHLRRNQRQKARSSWPLRVRWLSPLATEKHIGRKPRRSDFFFPRHGTRQTVRPAKVGPPGATPCGLPCGKPTAKLYYKNGRAVGAWSSRRPAGRRAPSPPVANAVELAVSGPGRHRPYTRDAHRSCTTARPD